MVIALLRHSTVISASHGRPGAACVASRRHRVASRDMNNVLISHQRRISLRMDASPPDCDNTCDLKASARTSEQITSRQLSKGDER